MEVTIDEFLKIPLMKGSEIVAGVSGKEHVVKSLSLMDSVDGWQYLTENMLAVTSGYVLASAQDGIEKLICQMHGQGIPGATVKKRYFKAEIYEKMIRAADEQSFPIIELGNNEEPFSMLFEYFNVHIYSRKLHEYLRIDSVSTMLVSAVNTNGLSGLARKCYDWTGKPVSIVLKRAIINYPETEKPSKLDKILMENGYLKHCTDIDADTRIMRLKTSGTAARGIEFTYNVNEHGAIWFSEETEECDDNAITVLRLSKSACELSVRQISAFEQDEDEMRREFTESLLSGTLLSYSDNVMMARRLKWRIPAQLQILLITQDDDKERNKQIDLYIQNYLDEKRLNIMVCFYESNLVLMLPGDLAEPLDTVHELRQQLLAKWPDRQFTFALGRLQDLRKAHISYQQAKLAMTAGMLDGRADEIISIDETGLYRLCESGTNSELTKICHELIDPLIVENKNSELDLIGTLKTFFRCCGNYTKTGQALFIHPNTVRYRLGVAEKLCSIDLDNYHDSLRMQVALLLMPILFPNI